MHIVCTTHGSSRAPVSSPEPSEVLHETQRSPSATNFDVVLRCERCTLNCKFEFRSSKSEREQQRLVHESARRDTNKRNGGTSVLRGRVWSCCSRKPLHIMNGKSECRNPKLERSSGNALL